jgi:hypothetical protein
MLVWLRRLLWQRPELPVAQLRGESPRDGAEQPLTFSAEAPSQVFHCSGDKQF